LGKKKLTINGNTDLLDEIEKIITGEGKGVNGTAEEYLEYIATTNWMESLTGELGIGKLEPTTEKEIPETRPKGLDAGRILRQIRKNRAERITNTL